MLSPQSSVPFVEYVLKALEHPPFMFVSKLAACCTMLFLTRSDPDLLRLLCHKWAIRFSMDRMKLLDIILKRSQQGRGKPYFCRQSSIDMLTDKEEGLQKHFDPEEAVDHFLKILNSLVPMYFSWNWHKTDYVIQINKEYEVYVRENLLPICIATSAEDGEDDDEMTTWLFPPSSYLSSSMMMLGSNYNTSPTMRETPALPLTLPCGNIYSNSINAGSQGPHSPAFPSSCQSSDAPRRVVYSGAMLGDGADSNEPSFLSTSDLASYGTLTVSTQLQPTGTFPPEGLTFLSFGNFREAVRRNTNGMVIVFHAKYSVKSNEVLEMFQEIIRKKLLDPMPTIAVVYSVAEPELATLYNISWFPTIIYVPVPDHPAESHVDSTVTAMASPTSTVDGGSTRAGSLSLRVSSPNHYRASLGVTQKTSTYPMQPSPTSLLFGFNVNETSGDCASCHTPIITTATKDRVVGSNSCVKLCPGGGGGMSNSDPCGVGEGRGSVMILSASLSSNDEMDLTVLVEGDNHKIYPVNGVTTIPALTEWVRSKGMATPRVKKIKDFVTRVNAIRAEQKFKQFRELHSAVVMLRRLQGTAAMTLPASHSSHRQEVQHQHYHHRNRRPGQSQLQQLGARPSESNGDSLSSDGSISNSSGGSNGPLSGHTTRRTGDPPLFIFLGGGMAAGKTTAAMALAHSAWWKNHKDQSVLVNADEFKVADPLYQCPKADVHTRSTRAAESLLVQAVNQGRSIVFDGTMMWAPFVLQVIDMVRNAHKTLYKQGPGYKEGSEEVYFLPVGPRPTCLSAEYKIHFLGITVEPEIAVPRGFLRKFSTGRGVPISTQLRSFKLFSENFPSYALLVDSATLYNNNVMVNLADGELPPVLAELNEHTERQLRVHDEAAYQMFLKQRTLNEDADNVLEVYPATPTTQ